MIATFCQYDLSRKNRDYKNRRKTGGMEASLFLLGLLLAGVLHTASITAAATARSPGGLSAHSAAYDEKQNQRDKRKNQIIE
jgi:hypothetical protein